jgi:hypothetical protein
MQSVASKVSPKIWEHAYQELIIELPLEDVDFSAQQSHSVGEYQHW